MSKLSPEDQQEDSLADLAAYIKSRDTDPRTLAHNQVWGRSPREIITDFIRRRKKKTQDFDVSRTPLEILDNYLSTKKRNAVILFDSLDDYKVGASDEDRIVGALLRYVSQFNFQNQNMRLKVAFPSEIFPEIQRASKNPLKDFPNYGLLSWSSMELAQIAAFRYSIFLEHFSPDVYREIEDIDINQRDGTHKFWEIFFSDEQTNRYGQSESAMIYMLRHTQLLPRQLLRILERVVLSSNRRTGGYRLLTKEAVSESIENMETVIAGEIFSAYINIFPYAQMFCKAILGRFPTVFSYDELEDRFRKVANTMGERWRSELELHDFIDMLLRMGILGEVVRETDRYMESKFSYNMLIPSVIGDKELLCIHPLFSKYFSCSPNKQRKAILPQGVSF
jgi:hypothetical protein